MSEQKLKEAFIEGLGISPDLDFCSLKYRGIEEWDSVGHMALVSCIEEIFGITLKSSEILEMISFKKAKNMLSRYGIKFA